MFSPFYYLQGTLKGNILVYLNYTFRKTSQIGVKTYWRCRRGCNVSIVLENENMCSVSGFNHFHENDIDEIKILTFKNNLRSSVAENPNTLPEKLYRRELAKWTMADRIKMPQYVSMRSTLYTYRKEVLPKLPKCPSTIEMEGLWALTCDGEPFILHNNEENDKILILGTEKSLSLLCKCKLILMDGTFKAVPQRPKFKQLYTIHGEIEGKIFPLLYCLLPDMKCKTYERLFNVIKSLSEQKNLSFSPSKIQIDFEIAVINAIRNTFPTASIKGCYFHFAQSIWRKVQGLGLSSLYSQDSSLKMWIKKLISLALVPLEMVDDAWLELNAESPNCANISLLLDYVVETWLDDDNARFNRNMWNHFDTISHRTTNALESWHSRLNSDLNTSHPNFWNFISILKSDQQYIAVKVELALQHQLLCIVKRTVREREEQYVRYKEELLTQKIDLNLYMLKVSRFCPSSVQ